MPKKRKEVKTEQAKFSWLVKTVMLIAQTKE